MLINRIFIYNKILLGGCMENIGFVDNIKVEIDSELLFFKDKILSNIGFIIEDTHIPKIIKLNLKKIHIISKSNTSYGLYKKDSDEIIIYFENIEKLNELLIHEISHFIFNYQLNNIKSKIVSIYKFSNDLDIIDEILAFYNQFIYLYNTTELQEKKFLLGVLNFLKNLIQDLRETKSLYIFSQVIAIIKFFEDIEDIDYKLNIVGEKTKQFIQLLNINFTNEKDLLNCYSYISDNKLSIIEEILLYDKKVMPR